MNQFIFLFTIILDIYLSKSQNYYFENIHDTHTQKHIYNQRKSEQNSKKKNEKNCLRDHQCDEWSMIK